MAAMFALCIITCSGAAAQSKSSVCDDLRAKKGKVYGFHPAQLDEAQLAAKGKETDTFWKDVQSAGPAGVSCLRGMLAGEQTDHIFQFDGAQMLYQADPSPQNLPLVRDSIAQADFQESDPAAYLSLALELSRAGVDVQALAARLLRYPTAVIHVSEHALDLDSDTAALFLYGSIDPKQASAALAGELQAPESFVRSAAAHLLAEEMTEESFRTLSQWDGFAKIEEDYRRNDVHAVMAYQGGETVPDNTKFTREQVLRIIAALPHTRREFDDLMATRGAAFDKRMRESKSTQEEVAKAVAESEPIYGIADHTAFFDSAVATLKPEDFATIRDARRKSLYNVSDETLGEYLAFTQLMIRLVNHLDLFKEYRGH